jgi:hypothetical protein
MCDFKIADAFTVYSSNRATIVQLWSFYSAVTLAILAFTVGSDKVIHRKPSEIALIIFGYVALAVGNAWAVVGSQAELLRMANGIKALMAKDPSLPYFSVDPISPCAVAAFYVVMTSVVSLAIYIRLKRQQQAVEVPATPPAK